MKTLVFSLLATLPLLSFGAKADVKIEKVAKHSMVVAKDVNILIDGTNTDMEIQIWEEERMEIEATFRYRGDKHLDKMEEFGADFESKLLEGILQSEGQVNITTIRSLPKKVKVGVADFTFFEQNFSRDELQLVYKIKMPGKGKVNIKHSYRGLRILGDLADLTLSQYSGRLSVDEIKQGHLSLKYGETRLGNITSGSIMLYENDLTTDSLGKIDLKIKYSDLRARSADKLKVEAYESELEFMDLNKIDGNFKYSRVRSPRLNKGSIESYESQFRFERADKLSVGNSKYCSFDLGEVDQLSVGQGYEDKLKVKKINSFSGGNSKYCKYEIEQLADAFSLKGYECQVQIDGLSEDTGKITIDGKYLKVGINVAEKVFQAQVNLKYGNVDYRRAEAEASMTKTGDAISSTITSTKQSNDGGYQMQLMGYEVNVELY